MKGVPFKDQNGIMHKPDAMKDSECSSLHVKKTSSGGYPATESVFELSDEELAIINQSKRIRLGILGSGMPPVYLDAEPVGNEIDETFKSN